MVEQKLETEEELIGKLHVLYEKEVIEVLKDGKLIVTKLMEKLGYDLDATSLDIMTRQTEGLPMPFKALPGSFVDSKHQHALSRLVDKNIVKWELDDKMNNYYQLA